MDRCDPDDPQWWTREQSLEDIGQPPNAKASMSNAMGMYKAGLRREREWPPRCTAPAEGFHA